MSKRKAIPKKIRIKLYEKYNHRCAYCGCELEYNDMQIDHIKSIYANTDFKQTMTIEEMYTLGNLAPACRQCNFYKSSMELEVFRNRLTTVLIPNIQKTFQYRVAFKYGLIKEYIKPVKFYFEQLNDQLFNEHKNNFGEIEFDDFTYSEQRKIIFGKPGSGKAIHPWDGLRHCFCGEYPWMVGKDEKDFHSGLPYKIICLYCKRETSLAKSLDELSTIKKEWNDNIAIKNLSEVEKDFKNLLNNARERYKVAQVAEEQLFDYITNSYPDLQLECVSTEAENAENLEEAITCYINYGEYTIDEIWSELKKNV